MSLTIEATKPPTAVASAEPTSLTAAADFAAALRDFTEQGEDRVKRFARLNAYLRTDRPAYPDLKGCRSWLVW